MSKNILKQLLSDTDSVLTESAQQQITEAVTARVDELVEERLDIALSKQDEENTAMLQQVVEKYEATIKSEKEKALKQLDEDHAHMTKEAFDKIEQDRTKKLIQVKEHYERLLEKTVRQEMDVLSKSIDVFIENFIDDQIPKEIFQEAARQDHSTELLKKISRLVTFDTAVTDEVKSTITESTKTIEEQAKRIEMFELKEFLREQTKNLPSLERKYIVESLKGHNVEYAKRNLAFIRKMFSSNSSKRVVAEKTSYNNIDRTVQVVEESTKKPVDEEAKPNSAMAVWVQGAMTNKPFSL